VNIPFINDALFWKFVTVLLILLVGWIVIKITVRVLKKALDKAGLDPAAHVLISRILTIVMWVLVILLAISELDKSLMGPLLTVLGTCGVAIALALKDSLGNVAGGLILVFTHPFTAGDEVEIGGNTGLVDSIDLFTTHLHTYDNRIIIIPNGVITNSTIVNATMQDLRRVDGVFSISYDSDVEKAKRIFHEIAEEGPMLRTDPAPFIAMTEHGENSLMFKVGIWCTTEDRFVAADYIKQQVKIRFDEEGIEIPYPHMEVRVQNVTTEDDE
jgi:small conductance mechanosensitive channel